MGTRKIIISYSRRLGEERFLTPSNPTSPFQVIMGGIRGGTTPILHIKIKENGSSQNT